MSMFSHISRVLSEHSHLASGCRKSCFLQPVRVDLRIPGVYNIPSKCDQVDICHTDHSQHQVEEALSAVSNWTLWTSQPWQSIVSTWSTAPSSKTPDPLHQTAIWITSSRRQVRPASSNDMNSNDGFCFSKSRRPLISRENLVSISYRIHYLGSPLSRVGQDTLTHPAINLKPFFPFPMFLQFLCSPYPIPHAYNFCLLFLTNFGGDPFQMSSQYIYSESSYSVLINIQNVCCTVF
jgi:hypothetical protein